MGEKTYRARTMKEALARVRRDLGGDAIILALDGDSAPAALSVSGHGQSRWWRLPPCHRGQRTANDSLRGPHRWSRRTRSAAAGARKPVRRPARPSARDGRNSEPPGTIDHLLPDLPGELVPTYANSWRPKFPEVVSRAGAACRREPRTRSGRATPALRAALCEAVEQCLAIAPPIQAVVGTRRMVALVGPTGVGKTTTVAKLAANFKLVHGVRVGLITVDTFGSPRWSN